jgi:hypothetical protein
MFQKVFSFSKLILFSKSCSFFYKYPALFFSHTSVQVSKVALRATLISGYLDYGLKSPAWPARWPPARLAGLQEMGGLGFRDFEIFNLSLLARQAWRIMENPETLSARILTSVYFPGKDLLSAELGKHPFQI